MCDRVSTQVLANGAIRYAVYDEQGNFLRYEYILPADDPTDLGTPLNKATLLSDETAAALGLTEESNTSSLEPTVDRALNALANESKNIGRVQYPDGTYKEIVPTDAKTLFVKEKITGFYATNYSSNYSYKFNKNSISFSPDGKKCVTLTGYIYNYNGILSYKDAEVVLINPNEKEPTQYKAEWPFADIHISYNLYKVCAFNDYAIVLANTAESSIYVSIYAITENSISLLKSQEIQSSSWHIINIGQDYSSQYMPYDSPNEPYMAIPFLVCGNYVFVNKNTLEIVCHMISFPYGGTISNAISVPFGDSIYISYQTNYAASSSVNIYKITKEGGSNILFSASGKGTHNYGLTVDPEENKLYSIYSISTDTNSTYYFVSYNIETGQKSTITVNSPNYLQYYCGTIYDRPLNNVFHPETAEWTNLPLLTYINATGYYYFGTSGTSDNTIFSSKPSATEIGSYNASYLFPHRIFKDMYIGNQYDFSTLIYGEIQEFVVVKV